MAGIIPRTSFLEEAGTLFTDQRIANARSKIIEWLNETAVGDSAQKCSAIVKIQEIVLSNIELLEEFIDNLLFLAHDSNQEVRKAVIGFVEHVCKSKIEYLPRVINVLVMLLRDSSPQVIKRVIQACASVYKNTLQWLCLSTDISENVEQSWTTLCLMKAQILDMIDHDNDGIRTNSVKFLEGVVILQTYRDEDSMKRDNDFSLDDVPMTLKIARRRKLEDEAQNIFDCLLKFHAAVHISSVNLITCTGSLCTIAKLRPRFMYAVIDALKKLYSNLPPTLTDSQVSSVRKNLKMQLVNILKHPASFEQQTTIVELLQDLGATSQEILKYLPRVDKYEHQRRHKRSIDVNNQYSSKRSKYDNNEIRIMPVDSTPMEIDYDALEEQRTKSTKINEKFISDYLKNVEIVIQLVLSSMKNLPNEPPQLFLNTYCPTIKKGIPQQISNIAILLAEQMTDVKIGPGAAVLSKEPPMRPAVSLDEERSIIQSARKDNTDMQIGEEERNDENMDINRLGDDNQAKKEEATKKLRENMDKAKGEQAVLQRMKQRVKTLKLQEVTKSLSHSTKEQFLIEAVNRILKSERSCMAGGVSAKYRHISTVIAASFSEKIRNLVLNFIMKDIKNRLDLAFSWIYEEYCLLQGFTRHSFLKSEHKPDFAYNNLVSELLNGICKLEEPKERVILLRRVYLESPLISDDAITLLTELCELQEMSHHGFELIKDLTVYRPPRKHRFLKILLSYCVHSSATLREKALENIITLYAVHKILVDKIEEFAVQWLEYIEDEIPPRAIFKAEYGRTEVSRTWDEDIVKICLNAFLGLMPYHEELLLNLSRVYTNTSADVKRTIIRAIEVPIRKMGPDSFEILRLIELCPKGVETLVTRIIHILTEKAAPTPELVSRVRELHKTKVTDVRLLIPILSALTKKEILNALPRLLKLNPVIVKEVFNRIFGIGMEHIKQPMPISPTEILVALHTIDPIKCELKFIVRATSLCLAVKHLYTQEVLAVCLQQLVEITPIPTLLMRTVIQSLTLYPRLAPFVVNLLQRLILKQVWKHKVIWDGFLKCIQRLKPQSLPVLIQLPPTQLQDALHQCPDLREPLLEHVKSITENQVGIISQQTMDILTGNAEDVFITDDTGGYIQLENIKKEKEDPDFIMATTGQPLPPGEDL